MAEELHFGRAALRLGLSQPQVSRQVASLERGLGVAVLERTARRVVLTEAGIELLPGARETLAAADRLARRARLVARTGGGEVTVGFIWSTLGGYLAPLVAAAAERHRQIELSVRQLRFLEVAPALRRGDVDLAITRGFRPTPELVAAELNREPSVVAIPAAHPLADAETVTLGDLDGQPLIALERDVIPVAFDAEMGRLVEAGIEPSARYPVISTSEGLALVAAGRGIYYRLARSAAVAQPGVVFRELEGVAMRTWLVRRAEPAPASLTAIEQLAHALFDDTQSASNDVRAGLDREAARP